MTPTLPLVVLLSVAAILAGGEAPPAVRGQLDGTPPAGLTVAIAKHGVEDPLLTDGRLATATVADDGTFALAAPTHDQYALTILRDGQVLWGRSHIKPGTDLGKITLPATGGGIEGTVVGGDGKALAGAVLRVWRKHDNDCDHWSVSHDLTADAEGGFAIASLGTGTWGVSLSGAEWAPTRRDVTVGSGMSIVELVAKPAAIVGGTVKDESGNLVAGATVEDDDGHTATTATDGTWRIGGLSPGEAWIRARAPGLALTDNLPLKATLSAGQTATVDLVLVRSGSLRISLRQEDPTAAMPTTVQVELERNGRGGYSQRPFPVVTGVVEVPDLGPGAYQLQVTAEGCGMAQLPVTIAAGSALAVEAVLPRVFAYTGTITAPEGIDLTKISIGGWIQPNGEGRRSSSRHHEAHVAADGSFRFSALEAGSLRLSIKAPGCIPQSHVIAIGAGGESDGTFAMVRGQTVRVRILDATGKPLPGADVRLDGPGDADWNAETADDGIATIEGVIDGELDLRVSHDEWCGHRGKLTVPTTEPAEIRLTAGLTITGMVLGADGKPLAEAYVSAYMPRGQGDHRSTRSSADGSFRLTGLRAGAWTISAHADGDTVAQLKAVAAGASGVTLQAKADAEIAITVLRPDGNPAAGIALTLDPEDAPSQELTTAADGRVTAKLKRGADWRLNGQPEGFTAIARNGTVPLDGPVPAIEVRLDAGRTLRGRLLGHDGRPVAGVGIALERQATRRRRAGGGETAQPDADGAFVLAGLAAGPAVVRATIGQQGQLLQRDVLIPAEGDPAVLDLVLPPCGSVSGVVPGRPGAKEKTTVTLHDPSTRVHLWCEAGADGSFRFAMVPAGTYTVVGYRMDSDDGSDPHSTSVTVQAGSETQAVFETATAGAGRQPVRGVVVRPEGVEGKARVRLIPDSGRPLTPSQIVQTRGGPNSEVAADGSFTFAGVPSGRYLLQVSFQGERGWEPTGSWCTAISIEREPLDLELRPRGIIVPVRILGPEGDPVEGAHVTVIPREGGLMQRWMGAANSISGADGNAEVRWLATPMVADLLVQHGEHGQLSRAEIVARSGMERIELRYGPRHALSGKVSAPPGAIVHLSLRSPDGFVRHETTADETGAYAFADEQGLQAGTWDLWAHAVGCAVSHRRLDVTAATTVDLSLVPGGRIALRVSGGNAAVGLDPIVRSEDGNEILRPRLVWEKANQPQLVIAPIDDDGTGEIDGLPAGTYSVAVPGAAAVRVTVTAHATVSAVLTVPTLP